MSRFLVILLRIILFIVLFYYLFKLIGRWLSSGGRGVDFGGKGSNEGKISRDYRHLTDQNIEDADFEEIEKGEKE